MRRLRNILDFLVVTAIGTLLVGALNWYPLLPERVVVHLNGAGEPNGWADRSMLLWGLIPGIGVALALGGQALIRWLEGAAATNPAGINLPQREKFLALPAESRRMVLKPLANYLRFITFLLLGLLIYIVEGLGRLSTGASDHWSSIPVFLFIGGVLVGVPLLIRSTSKAIEDTSLTGQARP